MPAKPSTGCNSHPNHWAATYRHIEHKQLPTEYHKIMCWFFFWFVFKAAHLTPHNLGCKGKKGHNGTCVHTCLMENSQWITNILECFWLSWGHSTISLYIAHIITVPSIHGGQRTNNRSHSTPYSFWIVVWKIKWQDPIGAENRTADVLYIRK